MPDEPPVTEITVEDATGTSYTVASLDELPRTFEPVDVIQIIEITNNLNDIADKKEEAEQLAEGDRQRELAGIDIGV